MRHFYVLLMLLVLGLPYDFAFGVPDEAFDRPQVVAVEPRAFNPRYDITANLGFLPIDAFYKGLTYGVSYTQSYTSLWSWEIVNANYSSKMDTNLKKDLLSNFNVRPQGILDHVQWFALSNVVYTPIYSKNLLFNQRILYGSTSLVLGGGMVGFSEGDVVPALGGGVIIRAFHSEKYSSKFDFRSYMHFGQGKSSDVILMITYGLSFELGNNKPLAR